MMLIRRQLTQHIAGNIYSSQNHPSDLGIRCEKMLDFVLIHSNQRIADVGDTGSPIDSCCEQEAKGGNTTQVS